jgi:large subunit ribosomal protein L3
MTGLIGKKIGMTQVFDAAGNQVPVTVLQVGPCAVVQRKDVKKNGYDAVQLGFESQKQHRLTSAQQGHLKKAGVETCRVLREVRLGANEEAKVGDKVTVAIFKDVPFVDVTGITKGRGFQGVVKRHGMGGGPAAHGSMAHRRPGAIGNRAQPGRIFKNKRMPGHMGHVRVTCQNLKVVEVREDDNLLLVRGSVPGANGSLVMVSKAVKKSSKAAGKS